MDFQETSDSVKSVSDVSRPTSPSPKKINVKKTDNTSAVADVKKHIYMEQSGGNSSIKYSLRKKFCWLKSPVLRSTKVKMWLMNVL